MGAQRAHLALGMKAAGSTGSPGSRGQPLWAEFFGPPVDRMGFPLR